MRYTHLSGAHSNNMFGASCALDAPQRSTPYHNCLRPPMRYTHLSGTRSNHVILSLLRVRRTSAEHTLP